MRWRTIAITGRVKIDLSLNYLEVRGDATRKVHLSEIHTLIIESTAVSMTACLLSELTKRKIKVIFCDEKRNPQAELIPYYGSHDSSAKVRQQVLWNQETKDDVWAKIVAEKIKHQQRLLRYAGEDIRADMLTDYINDLQPADASNREGHAAKVYFNGFPLRKQKVMLPTLPSP